MTTDIQGTIVCSLIEQSRWPFNENLSWLAVRAIPTLKTKEGEWQACKIGLKKKAGWYNSINVKAQVIKINIYKIIPKDIWN